MIGTRAVSELGGPMTPSAFGPSQPSAPTTQVSERSSPSKVSNRSESVRRKTRSSTAISSSAIPTRGAMPSSVAFRYSSSTTVGEMLLTLSGPSCPTASSWIVRSASGRRSSPVSRRRMVAMAMGVPSVSVPVIAASAPPISGMPVAASISACVIDATPSAWSAAWTMNDGATTASPGASSAATSGSPRMSPSRASIWASPSGVRVSPRKRSVTTLTSPVSSNRSSICRVASATAFPGGRNARAAPSITSARRPVPAASTTVTASRTAIVT